MIDMSKPVPDGYVEVALGENVPKEALYLSTSGNWEPTQCWDFKRMYFDSSHARFAVRQPEPSVEDRWDEI
jgi:hypothetical protein